MKVYAKQDTSAFSLQIQCDTCAPFLLHLNQTDLLPYQEVILPCDPWKLTVQVVKTDSAQSFFELYGISLENPSLRGILYHSLGINGCKLEDLLKEDLAFRQMREMSPDLVIIDLGGNDYYPNHTLPQSFESNLRTLVEKIRNATPRTSILLVTNQSVLYRHQEVKAVQEAREVIRKVAMEYDCAFYDWYAVSGGEKSMWHWYRNQLAKKDHVHLTFKGYQLKGELFTNALLTAYHRFWLKKPLDSIPIPPQWHHDSSVHPIPPQVHIVQKGETLSDIARKYHTSVNALMEWNRLTSSRIYPGQRLLIYSSIQSKGQSASPSEAIPTIYTVKPGDTLWRISQRYGIPIAKLKEWNQLTDPVILHPGQKLRLKPR
jgi:LysM repeat protein/lysophospholipase L1-like esterase